MSQFVKSVQVCALLSCSLWVICAGQLSFHTDTNTNSFALKAPGIQQVFTRYFGGQQGALLQQAQSSQNHAQVVAAPGPAQQVQEGQQQVYLSPQDYAAYLQQFQDNQAQQQPQHSPSLARQQHHQTPVFPNTFANQSPSAPAANLLGVAFSPSNKVSHVKFSSAGLAYNF